MKRLVFVFFILVGCSTLQTKSINLPVRWVDHPDKKIIEIFVQNKNLKDKTVCIDSQHWPNYAHKVHYAGEIIHLKVEGQTYAYKQMDTGVCYPKCGEIRIPDGDTLHGTLRYDDFNLPENLYSSKKTLVYDLNGTYCR